MTVRIVGLKKELIKNELRTNKSRVISQCF